MGRKIVEKIKFVTNQNGINAALGKQPFRSEESLVERKWPNRGRLERFVKSENEN
jgi:hypothetical protein